MVPASCACTVLMQCVVQMYIGVLVGDDSDVQQMRCHRQLGPPEFSVRRTHFPRELGPPPGPKSLDAQNQLNRTHFPRELSPPRTEIPVPIYIIRLSTCTRNYLDLTAV